MTDINSLLTEREKTHGNFADVARVACAIRSLAGMSSHVMDDVLVEALSMIASKQGRIISGDHDCKEHWLDIAGYAMLAVNYLERGKPE